jgi:Zn-finger domain-containing protein
MASAIVRMMPRVKHDHKDAIIAVVKVDYAAYKEGKNTSRTNPYFNSHSKQEQSQFSVKIKDDIHCETGFDDCKNYDNFDRRAKNEAILRCYRKMNKYNYNSIGA